MKAVLICAPLRFYTSTDEDLFFEWLKKIPSIDKYIGKGAALYTHVTRKSIPEMDLLNLMGIFERYKFDKKELLIFKNDDNKEWFED